MASFDFWRADEERALAPARMIESLFHCPPTPPSAVDLPSLIAHSINRTWLSSEVICGALVLLQRLHNRYPNHEAASAHRLFLAALIISQKSQHDRVYSNYDWSVVGSIVPGLELDNITIMEKQLLAYLRWEVIITPEDMANVESDLHHIWSIHALPSPPQSPRPSFRSTRRPPRPPPPSFLTTQALSTSTTIDQPPPTFTLTPIFSTHSSSSSVSTISTVASDDCPRTPLTPLVPIDVDSTSPTSKSFAPNAIIIDIPLSWLSSS